MLLSVTLDERRAALTRHQGPAYTIQNLTAESDMSNPSTHRLGYAHLTTDQQRIQRSTLKTDPEYQIIPRLRPGRIRGVPFMWDSLIPEELELPK